MTMQTLKNIYRTVQKLRSLEGEAINTGLTVSERLLLGNLRDWGML